MVNRRDFLYASAGLAAAPPGAAGRPAPRTGRRIRMAVAGGGFGSKQHFHEHPNCDVVAVTDLRSDRLRRLRNAYRCDNAYDSLEDLLKSEKNLDAVAVYTFGNAHARHALICFERGLHVISACPACWSVEEAEQLKEAKERTGLRYMLAESSYYRQAAIYARNLYRAGGFGRLFYSEVEYYHDLYREFDQFRDPLEREKVRKRIDPDRAYRWFDREGKPAWRWGLPPLHYPTHALGYLVGVTGERMTKVSALGWGPRHNWRDNPYGNPYMNECAMMQTSCGHMLRCNVFWAAAAGGERAQWFGEKGSLYMRNGGLHGDVRRERNEEAKPVEIPEYWRGGMLPEPMRHASGHGGSAVFLAAEFVNALLEDREPAIDLYESLAMTVPGIVGHQSALKNGEQLKVPQFDKG